MKSIGVWMVILGIGSFVLHFFGYEFKLLMWVDHWGEWTGNAIRSGLIVVGLAIGWLFSSGTEES